MQNTAAPLLPQTVDENVKLDAPGVVSLGYLIAESGERIMKKAQELEQGLITAEEMQETLREEDRLMMKYRARLGDWPGMLCALVTTVILIGWFAVTFPAKIGSMGFTG